MKIRKLAKHNSGGLGLSLSSLFSEDILTEIFLWLPLKSLIRFKRLSKRWYFLILHKDSYFRRNYLSTLSRRRRNRIVGSDDFNPATMAGFFYQKPEYWGSYDGVRFLPTTSTQFKKYFFLPSTQFKKYNIRQGEGGGTTTTPRIEIVNNINPFSSLDKSLDEFLSCCLRQDQDQDPAAHQNTFITASSNGFLLCSLGSCSSGTYYLVNPVTMEWVALPILQNIGRHVYVGFVCKGDYPSLDLVEYTIVRVSSIEQGVELLFQFFSSGDDQWREYRCSCESMLRFSLPKQNPLIVSTATNSDDQGEGGGGGGIAVYFLVIVQATMAIAILVFDLNKGDNSLQMIETPGPERGRSVLECPDYIREFDDGVIHYVRICCSTDFEFWVLNIESREWCLKHRASLKTMMEGYTWTDVRKWNGRAARQWNEAVALYRIHAFHPMNPNLIFLTLYGRMVCYNVETGTLELVYNFSAQNMLDAYRHYVYQWPCWPPLL